MLKLYNTLTRKVETIEPIREGEVSLYTCGPTVYDYAHVGNLRSFVFDDTLRRVIAASQLDVKHVMNITDVGHLISDADEGDDKLEAGAKREGKSVWDVANHYINAFLKDMSALNVLPPNGYSGQPGGYARATDFIKDQLEIVKLLIDKSFAYQTKQAIYFDIAKMPNYGELSGQKLTQKETGAREEVVTDPAKRNPQDFALWFFAVGRFADHEMRWPSPWGEGFPGWHLECSAIIHATLGDPIDIHTGGVDHIGTHHPNEMAQTAGAFGHDLAKYWLHNEFLQVDGYKMAKSRGNYLRLADIVSKGYNPLALRLLFLQTHYRNQMNFTFEGLDAAATNLVRLQGLADLRYQLQSPAKEYDFVSLRADVLELVQNDLGTPAALARLNLFIDQLEAGGQVVSAKQAGEFKEFLAWFDELFGLKLLGSPDLSDKARALIEQRETARQAKNWAEADRLRDELAKDGIGVNDTAVGPIWQRLKR